MNPWNIWVEIFPDLPQPPRESELLQPAALPTSLHVRDRLPFDDAEWRWQWKPKPDWPL